LKFANNFRKRHEMRPSHSTIASLNRSVAAKISVFPPAIRILINARLVALNLIPFFLWVTTMGNHFIMEFEVSKETTSEKRTNFYSQVPSELITCVRAVKYMVTCSYCGEICCRNFKNKACPETKKSKILSNANT
jgi:hypothetical protein